MGRYPAIEPYDHGLLDVGDGNRVYWEASGRPDGLPAVVVHGGPGSGTGPGWRRWFDPDRYRIILFDQRGCGRSLPHASDPTTDLSVNTTDHLVRDMERLREHLGVDRWLLFGGSWGCVLSLVYAERHPGRVSAIVQSGIATGRRVETDLLTRGLGRVYPDAWARFVGFLREDERDGDLAAAYHRYLEDPDPAVRAAAALSWANWEDAMLPSLPATAARDAEEDPARQLAFARLVTHYWSHGHFIEDGQVLRDAELLAGIPGVLVQGTLDPNNLVGTPWLLHEAWPDSELVIVEDASHSNTEGGMPDALVAATDRLRGLG